MSTKSKPGLSCSSTVTVLVAVALDGFHWKLATPSVFVTAVRESPVPGVGSSHVKPPVLVETVVVKLQPGSGL
jgi:hypothetical protein